MSGLRTRLSALALRLLGWRVEGTAPQAERFVLVCAPHTSLWDSAFLLLGSSAVGLRLRWVLKASYARPPWGWLLRALGAVPVEPSGGGGLVDQMIAAFRAAEAAGERLELAIAPSGTRAKRAGWRTGFHVIARGAGVPIAPGSVDYRRKLIRVGPAQPTAADAAADVAALAPFFEGAEGRHPALQTPIRIAAQPDRGGAS